MLTPRKVHDWVDEIAAIAADAERAHSEADSLLENVLEAIANGDAFEPHECAREALRVRYLGFSRWCA